MKKFFTALLGVLSVIYLLNPSLGVFEFLPDNIPFVGNIDEATVTVVLLWVLSQFGIDVSKWFGKKDKDKPEIKE